MNVRAVIKSFLSRRKRKKYISLVIHSNLVSETTEVSTAIRMAEELSSYIEKGDYSLRTLPNGYRWAEQPTH